MTDFEATMQRIGQLSDCMKAGALAHSHGAEHAADFIKSRPWWGSSVTKADIEAKIRLLLRRAARFLNGETKNAAYVTRIVVGHGVARSMGVPTE